MLDPFTVPIIHGGIHHLVFVTMIGSKCCYTVIHTPQRVLLIFSSFFLSSCLYLDFCSMIFHLISFRSRYFFATSRRTWWCCSFFYWNWSETISFSLSHHVTCLWPWNSIILTESTTILLGIKIATIPSVQPKFKGHLRPNQLLERDFLCRLTLQVAQTLGHLGLCKKS